MAKGRVLRIYDTKAVLENLDATATTTTATAATGSCLLISQSRDTGARQFERFNKSQPPADLGPSSQVLPFEAIFGFYDLLSGSYIALVVESEPYISIPLMNMRKAKKIIVVPLFRNGRVLSDSKQRDEDRYLQLLHMSLAEHTFYFSTNADITLTQQRIAKLSSKAASEPVWSRADLRFFWNRDLVEDLVMNQADDWIVPFMNAYIELRSECTIEDLKVSLLFISRRSKYRQGCRFTKRGVDDNGHTANFVETEQILIFPDGKVTSYVEVRGSIPLKWISPVHMRYDPAVFIDSDNNKSIECATKHMRELMDKYSDNNNNSTLILINLIDNKKDQGRLGVAYKDIVDSVRPYFSQPNCLQYVWFDFHHECKQKGKWKNLSKLVMQVDDAFRQQKYFCKLASGQVTSWQSGVIRTNCMDNLDRTNVVQSLFARRSLVLQLGKQSSIEFNGAHVMDTPWKQFEKIFKTMWTNNADAMSMGYAGTGALKTDFTKTGKRTFKGMFNDGVNSCMRYYINNLTDGVKQDAIDLMLGRYRPDPSGSSPFSQRTAQEAISSNLTKVFALLMIVFSSLLILLPPVIPIANIAAFFGNQNKVDMMEEVVGDVLEKNVKHLQTNLLIALSISFAILAFMMYKIVKKGSKIGEKIVIHPELCPEPLPPGRA